MNVLENIENVRFVFYTLKVLVVDDSPGIDLVGSSNSKEVPTNLCKVLTSKQLFIFPRRLMAPMLTIAIME